MNPEDNHYVRFVGKASIPEPMAMGVAYQVWIDGEITAITNKNNQDGTKSVYHKFEPIRAEIKDSKGIITKTKDMRSMAQKMRASINYEWTNQTDEPRDAEKAYEDTMKELFKFVLTAYKTGKEKQ